ncbi:ribulose-phosphate 3-epimerase [Flaviflexus salsibiostraticola]|uniref:Ribulose-phosphate 3-epimerase n=1 Tax=Flaviflexus salsibiostraticola TaxID=1282737 RepID=A0A3Q8WSK4_9ACTO|nr:ribulose-phosphate 3-epimerase [Flaviflexus salsibiostraticola]AZN29279.1 ribulose-phosphate 3-epimerase [Flaviflexus salsibiostraticola]
MSILISPSILNSDIGNLAGELNRISNADWAHVDVMDNHFVPNLTWGIPVIEAAKKYSPVPIDAHLMIANPDRWVPGFVEAGADSVTFHAEAVAAPIRLAREVRAMGARAGIALNPATQIDDYIDILDEFDMVLCMTVEPGFGGQPFIASVMPKVARLRELINKKGLETWIQVDGGVSADTIAQAAEAGANNFVAGSAVYKAEDAANAVDTLRELARSHSH